MVSRKQYEEFCCTPEGNLKPRIAPEYTHEDTIDYEILVGAENYFASRDEQLRFHIVKRLVQWMMDTDDNAFFDEAHRNNTSGLRSTDGIGSYMSALRYDAYNGLIGKELETLNEYLLTLGSDIPEQYSLRYGMLVRSTHGLADDPYETNRRVERELRFASWLRPGSEIERRP